MTTLQQHREQHPDLARMTCADIDIEAALCMGACIEQEFYWCFPDHECLLIDTDDWEPCDHATNSQMFAAFVARETGEPTAMCVETIKNGLVSCLSFETIVGAPFASDVPAIAVESASFNEATTRACVAAMRRHAERSEG